jgi:hypothetical protein
MYSASSIAVDKGLGFDFSNITNLVKSALPVGLNIYQNQMQVKQVKALAQVAQQGGYAVPSAGQYVQLPMSQVMQSQPTFGPGYVAPPRSGMDTSTMLLLGVGAIGLLFAVKMITK